MRITVKVKHLVLAALALCLAVPLYIQVAAPRLKVYMAQRHYEQGSPEGAAQLLQVLSEASGEQRASLVLKWIISRNEDSWANSYQVYAGSGSLLTRTSHDSISRNLTHQEMLPFLEEYVREAAPTPALIRAAKQAATYYRLQGSPNKALAILNLGEDRLGGGAAASSLILSRAELLADLNRLEEAEKLLLSLVQEPREEKSLDYAGDVALLRIRLLMSRGNLTEALELAKRQELALSEIWQQQKPPASGAAGAEPLSPLANMKLKELNEQLRRSLEMYGGHPAAISGSVKRSDGTPLTGTGVFLRDRSVVNTSVRSGEPYQTMTDSEGNYSFTGVLPGSYQLTIGLQYDQTNGWLWPVQTDAWIDVAGGATLTENIVFTPLIELRSPVNEVKLNGPSIRFEWEPVKGAAYYTLNGGFQSENGWYSTSVRSHISSNSLELPVEELYDAVSGYAFDEVDGHWTVLPASLLGFTNPEARFSWSINAYTAQGDQIASSNGYRLNESDTGSLPFFYLTARELTEADRLLLAGKHEEALAAYEAVLEKSPQDLHSLRMAIRLLESQLSLHRSPEELANNTSAQRERVNQETEYEARLLQMVKLHPAPTHLSKLTGFYYEQKDWAAFEHYYAQRAVDSQMPPTVYERSQYALAQMQQMKLTEARQELESVLKDDSSHRFTGSYLALVLYGNGSLEEVRALALRYPERSFAYNGRDWSWLINNMIQEQSGYEASTYREELRKTLEWVFRGQEGQLETWLASSANGYSSMAAFVSAVKELLA